MAQRPPPPAPSTTLHPRPAAAATGLSTTASSSSSSSNNPLPPLIQTPTGLALLELQGTINLPPDELEEGQQQQGEVINIGRVDFPDYRPGSLTFDPASTAWMRRVYLFVGQHQRLTGEVRKLPRALGVVRRRGRGPRQHGDAGGGGGGGVEGEGEELEVVEIVKYKIVFSSRPEPVGSTG